MKLFANLPQKRLQNIITLLFILLPLFYYLFFMSKTVGHVDSSMVLYNAYELKISIWANNHNLFSLISFLLIKLFSQINPFIVSNGFSAICGALTVFFGFLLSRQISKSNIIATAVAIILMISHSLSWHSTMLEVYTLNTFMLMAMMYSFYRYFETKRISFAYWGSFIWGLGVSNHALMGLFVFSFISFLISERKSLKLVNVLLGILCFLLGASLFFYAFFKSIYLTKSLSHTLFSLAGGDFKSLMFSTKDNAFWIKNYILFFFYQYSLPAVILGGIGLKTFINKKPFSFFFLTGFLIQLAWSLNYHVWDVFAFALPVYVLFSIPIASGLASLQKAWVKKTALALLITFTIGQVLLYNGIHRIPSVRNYFAHYPMIDHIGEAYDPVAYFMKPWKHNYNDVYNYLEKAGSLLPENSWVYDNVYDYPMHYYYQTVEKKRQDINSPIVFAFFVRRQEKIRLANKINIQVERGYPVFLSQFVFNMIEKRLKFRKREKFHITETGFLYQLKN